MSRTPYQRERDEARIEDVLVKSGAVPRGAEIIHTKVVGVMHCNADGSSRQEAIGGITQFDELELVRNPEDEYDSNAIQVFATVDRGAFPTCRETRRRVQIGHLPAEIAEQIAPQLDAGAAWKAIASRVSFHISRGVSVLLFRAR